MAAYAAVIFTLFGRGERLQSSQLAIGAEGVASAGQYLVTIGLVAHIPHYAVFRGVKHIVERHSYFHGPKAGGQMTRMFGQHFYYAMPDFAANLRQLLHAELAQVGRRVYLVK